jgi:hypothetical protein
VYHGNVGAAKLANWAPVGSEPIVNRPIELIRRSSFPVNTVPASFPAEPRRGCQSSGITPNWERANIGQHSVTYPMARSAPVRAGLLSRRLGSVAGSARQRGDRTGSPMTGAGTWLTSICTATIPVRPSVDAGPTDVGDAHREVSVRSAQRPHVLRRGAVVLRSAAPSMSSLNSCAFPHSARAQSAASFWILGAG